MFITALFIDIYTIARHGNNLSVHQWMNKENVDTHTHTHTWILKMEYHSALKKKMAQLVKNPPAMWETWV